MFPNPVSGGTPTLHIFQLFLIKHTWINSSLVETLGREIYWSDKGDIQNVHCWCASRNRVGKHCFRLLKYFHPPKNNCSVILTDISHTTKLPRMPFLNKDRPFSSLLSLINRYSRLISWHDSLLLIIIVIPLLIKHNRPLYYPSKKIFW